MVPIFQVPVEDSQKLHPLSSPSRKPDPFDYFAIIKNDIWTLLTFQKYTTTHQKKIKGDTELSNDAIQLQKNFNLIKTTLNSPLTFIQTFSIWHSKFVPNHRKFQIPYVRFIIFYLVDFLCKITLNSPLFNDASVLLSSVLLQTIHKIYDHILAINTRRPHTNTYEIFTQHHEHT